MPFDMAALVAALKKELGPPRRPGPPRRSGPGSSGARTPPRPSTRSNLSDPKWQGGACWHCGKHDGHKLADCPERRDLIKRFGKVPPGTETAYDRAMKAAGKTISAAVHEAAPATEDNQRLVDRELAETGQAWRIVGAEAHQQPRIGAGMLSLCPYGNPKPKIGAGILTHGPCDKTCCSSKYVSVNDEINANDDVDTVISMRESFPALSDVHRPTPQPKMPRVPTQEPQR